MSRHDPELLRRQLADGRWLTVPEMAALVGVSRYTILRWLDKSPQARFKIVGGGVHRRYRTVDPEWVRAVLAAREEIHTPQQQEE